jgi:hypothetical protein
MAKLEMTSAGNAIAQRKEKEDNSSGNSGTGGSSDDSSNGGASSAGRDKGIGGGRKEGVLTSCAQMATYFALALAGEAR